MLYINLWQITDHPLSMIKSFVDQQKYNWIVTQPMKFMKFIIYITEWPDKTATNSHETKWNCTAENPGQFLSKSVNKNNKNC